MIQWLKSKFQPRPQNSGTTTLANPAEWFINSFLGGKATASGKTVTPDTALSIIAVYACVKVLAESVASLPLNVYRRLPNGGKEVATNHPLHTLLHSAPNEDMTSFDLRELMMNHLCLRGTTYSQKIIDGAGRVRSIVPLHPDRMKVRRNEEGKLVYEYTPETPDAPVLMHSNEIWRTAGMGSNGIIGYSPIQLAREELGLSQALTEHGARLFANGAQLSGVLETDNTLTQEQVNRIKESWQEKYGGSENAFKTAILENGLKFSKVSLTNEDAQFLESKKYSATEAARLFRIPPHMIGDLEKATFSNIEHQDLGFFVHTQRPWNVRIEQSAARDLLLPRERATYFIEFNMEGFLRGDSKTRAEFYKSAIINGWMNRNEVRKLENKNPVEGLDEFLVPLNMTDAENLTQENNTSEPSDRMRRLTRSAANRIINREIKTIAKAIEKNQFTEDWVRSFYKNHKEFLIEGLAITEQMAGLWYTDRVAQLLSDQPAHKILKAWETDAAEQLTNFALTTELAA